PLADLAVEVLVLVDAEEEPPVGGFEVAVGGFEVAEEVSQVNLAGGRLEAFDG
ncbi:MAG: hypothetical protein GY722_27050, partial [bacterium]|nr:hypothetical protein [bacterium]